VATLRKRSNGHWQARVRKANQSITKTFINKVDAERWASDFKHGDETLKAKAERSAKSLMLDTYLI
jgi:hypothetical protein